MKTKQNNVGHKKSAQDNAVFTKLSHMKAFETEPFVEEDLLADLAYPSKERHLSTSDLL